MRSEHLSSYPVIDPDDYPDEDDLDDDDPDDDQPEPDPEPEPDPREQVIVR